MQQPATMWKFARLGAAQGALVWMVYWWVESFLLHIVPWIREPIYQYAPPHAGFTAVLLILYIAAGLITGALLGAAMGAWAARRHDDRNVPAVLRTAIALVLFLLVSIGSVLPRLPRELPPWQAGMVFLPVALSLLGAVLSSTCARRIGFLANPWTASAVVLGLPLVFEGFGSDPAPSTRALSFLLIVGVAIGINLLLARQQRSILPTISISALLLAACFLLHQEPRHTSRSASALAPADKPNVILITLDTVRADHLSLYGYGKDTTPNLEKLSEVATVYTNAIAPGDMTLSSHASIFTGLYPSQHGAHFDAGTKWGRPLESKYETLPEILSNRGFETVGIVANYLYLAPGFGLDRGFSYHDSAAAVPWLGTTKAYLLRERVRNLLTRFFEPWQYDATFRRAGAINQAALEVLDSKELQNRKFFCFLNYMDAHSPYLPPGRYATMYPGYDSSIRTGHYDGIQRAVLTLKRPLTDRERNHFVSQYDGGIAYMDWSLGRLVDQLKRRGLFENTLLIIASDHGEAFGERALLGHALSVYQDAVHVPLLIKYPHQNAKEVADDPVSLVDLMPTILDALGYAVPANVQGRSLLKREDPGIARSLISETFVHPFISTLHPRFLRSGRAIFSGSLKLIRSSKGDEELYDLAKDPNELQNLYPSASTAPLEAQLKRYMTTANALERIGAFSTRPGSKSVEKLKSLGYIQ